MPVPHVLKGIYIPVILFERKTQQQLSFNI